MNTLHVSVKVIPKSSKNYIEYTNGILRVHLNAPPVDGKANKALIELLASVIGVPKSHIVITHGTKGRNKLVAIHGIEEPVFIQRIQECMNKK